jgi:hypothetical protein
MTNDMISWGLVIIGVVVLVWTLWPKKKDVVAEVLAEVEKPVVEPVVVPVIELAREEIKADIDAKTEDDFVKAMETQAKVETPKTKKPAAKRTPAKAPKKGAK